MENPRVHKVVPVTVINHLPGGLLVSLPDGMRGVIRIRELSWDSSIRSSWQQSFPIGWKSEAIIVKEDRGQLELSLRLLQEDPWKEVNKYLHRTLQGTVTGSKHYGAFIEIAPGLTGLLHQSDLMPGIKSEPDDLFWPGDHVCVTVEEIHYKEQQISLALALLEGAPAELAALRLPSQNSTGTGTFANQLDQLLHAAHLRILIIENDKEQADSLRTWIEHLGQRVECAISADEGLKQVEKFTPHLALINLCLPGMSGLEVIRHIQAKHPEVRCVLTADHACMQSYAIDTVALHAERIEILLKPFEPEELLQLVFERYELDSKNEDDLYSLSTDPYSRALQQDGTSIQSLIEECCQNAEFDTAILFSLDPIKGKARIAAACGMLPDPIPPLDDLVFSPVRDVAEDNHVFIVEDAQQSDHSAHFQYLIRAFPFAACLGLHVPCHLSLQYALFLLHSSPREIYQDEMNYAQATALVVGNLLEKQLLLEQMTMQQRMIIVGNQATLILHEANNQLGTIKMALPPLVEDLATITNKWKEGKPIGQTEIENAETGSNRIQQATNSLTKIIGSYHNLSATNDYQVVLLDELMKEACDMLSVTSQKLKVDIEVLPCESLLMMRSQLGLLQQVFINLLLNSIQQLDKYRPQKGGKIWVQIEKAQNYARILISDNGPGIHRGWWERIFEPGFSTRKEGSGLGLYIARSIIRSMGGRIFVAESFILGGTTMAIELPLKL